jgi:hypothetical protein
MAEAKGLPTSLCPLCSQYWHYLRMMSYHYISILVQSSETVNLPFPLICHKFLLIVVLSRTLQIESLVTRTEMKFQPFIASLLEWNSVVETVFLCTHTFIRTICRKAEGEEYYTMNIQICMYKVRRDIIFIFLSLWCLLKKWLITEAKGASHLHSLSV